MPHFVMTPAKCGRMSHIRYDNQHDVMSPEKIIPRLGLKKYNDPDIGDTNEVAVSWRFVTRQQESPSCHETMRRTAVRHKVATRWPRVGAQSGRRPSLHKSRCSICLGCPYIFSTFCPTTTGLFLRICSCAISL